MTGFLAFCDKYKDEPTCIQALADLKWPDGFTCDKCQGRKAYHLVSRPRLFECAACGHQHSVTAGTIFHKTRTNLRIWFMAAYLIGHDKRGVSAMFICREFAIRYDTAWLMCHKLRHALTDDSQDFKLDDFVEVDEAFYGGRKQKGNRGRDEYKHLPIIQGVGENAGVNMPIIHKLFSNIKVWLNGTHHGVSIKHLPRYLREWSYRFNRRGRIADLDGFLLRRAVGRGTITYAELVGGRMVEGAPD